MRQRTSHGLVDVLSVGGLIVIDALLMLFVAHAQNAPLDTTDLQAALTECANGHSLLESRAQELAVELARANRELAQLREAKKDVKP